MIESSKSIFDGTLKWVYFWDYIIKTLQFKRPWWRHLPNNGSKRTQTCISSTDGDKKVKVDRKWKFEVKYSFLKTAISKFWSFDIPWWRHQPKYCVRKVQIGVSCTNVDIKKKMKSKMYFQVNYSFMKPFSQDFEVLTQRGDVIRSKLAQIWPNFALMT